MATKSIESRIKELHKANKSLNYIKAIVADEYKVPETEVGKKITELGLAKSQSGELEKFVSIVIKCEEAKVQRKDMVERLVKETNYTLSTVKHMVGQLALAREYHKQMSKK